jgi:CheY-like chemotaxis protein
MSSYRTLVIDDSEDIRELMGALLESVGHEVKTAPDGESGLQVARSFRPDLIITDLSMPGMGGLELLVRVRSDLAPPLPPVIVCSGFDTSAKDALRLGAARFVAKPVEASTLLSIVEEVLEGRTPAPSLLAREQAFAREARERAIETAARVMSKLTATTPDLGGVLTRLAQRMADYFAIAPACVALLDGDGFKVMAASRGCPVPAGTRVSSSGRFSTSILAARSSLVVPEARPFGPLSLVGSPDPLVLGFLVAVPLVVEDVPVGVLALAASEPRRFCAEDLIILESVGRLASQRLGDGGPVGASVELWPSSLIEVILSAELSCLHRARGGLDLLLADADPEAVDLDALLALLASDDGRLSVCRRNGPGSLAICKRDASAVSATGVVSKVLSTISKGDALRAAGWVSVRDEGLPSVAFEHVFELAERALEQARANPDRPVERIEVGVSPLPTGPALGSSIGGG